MLIPNAVLAGTRSRMQFDPISLRNFMRDKNPVDVNPPERVQNWIKREGATLERVLGPNDLQPIVYLRRGTTAGAAVCRVNVTDPATGQVVAFGTGFLIGPRLLITNHHVLENAATAGASEAEFNYEIDIDGKKTISELFALDASTFVTSEELDFSVVAVNAKSERGVDLSRFGFLHLDPTPGKTLDAQNLTIIQHPSGERKQIAIRENQLIKTLDNFLWYATDTAPGSSGSAVFNDTWQIVALHHSGVTATNAQGQTLTIDGKVADDTTPDSRIKWIANEGVRISSIAAELRKHVSDPLIAALLATSDGKTVPAPSPAPVGVPPPKPEDVRPPASYIVRPSADAAQAVQAIPAVAEKISIDPNYDNREGYDPAFLGTGEKRVPLPRLNADQMKDAAEKQEEDRHPPHVLAYHHYSVVFSARRHLAFYSAVNIDGTISFRLKRDPDNWKKDPRIDKNIQAGEELYAANDFDRGHLVRRLDPAWGDTQQVARVANDDTFHFTNCSPQHKEFNQGQTLWAGLEDYILNNADNSDLKVTVINGPVFDDENDQPYRGILIPKEYFKVVTMVKTSGKLSATAYVVSQAKLISSMKDEEFVFGQFRTFQIPIARLEQKTGLDFGKLRTVDPLGAGSPHEAATVGGRLIEDLRHIVL